MNDRKKAIIAMHKGGLTYDEIGKVLGISRQRVHQIAKRNKGNYFHAAAVEKIPYVGLRNWMMKNRVSVSELSRRCGVSQLTLDGKHDMRMDTANKVLRITGLTFNECFRRDDDGQK